MASLLRRLSSVFARTAASANPPEMMEECEMRRAFDGSLSMGASSLFSTSPSSGAVVAPLSLGASADAPSFGTGFADGQGGSDVLAAYWNRGAVKGHTGEGESQAENEDAGGGADDGAGHDLGDDNGIDQGDINDDNGVDPVDPTDDNGGGNTGGGNGGGGNGGGGNGGGGNGGGGH